MSFDDDYCVWGQIGSASWACIGQGLIAPGGFVVCDFGVILSGYCSDQTRTVWMGARSGVSPSGLRGGAGSATGRHRRGAAGR